MGSSQSGENRGSAKFYITSNECYVSVFRAGEGAVSNSLGNIFFGLQCGLCWDHTVSLSTHLPVLSLETKFLQFQTNPEKDRSFRLTLPKWHKNQRLSREKLLKQTHSGTERKKPSSFPFAPKLVASLGQHRSQAVRGCSLEQGITLGKQLCFICCYRRGCLY